MNTGLQRDGATRVWWELKDLGGEEATEDAGEKETKKYRVESQLFPTNLVYKVWPPDHNHQNGREKSRSISQSFKFGGIDRRPKPYDQPE